MEITVEELKERLDKGEDITIIDVREPHEHEEFNIGGENIPMNEIPLQIDELQDLKDKEVICYCRSGNRSGQITQFMANKGFNKVKNLKGGVLEWQEKFH